MKISPILAVVLALVSLSLPACHSDNKEEVHEQHKIVVTNPLEKDVVITQRYVCQIHSWRHINVRALQSGYLEQITIKEGQAVKEGDPMFRVIPRLYNARLAAEEAEFRLAQIKYNNTVKLSEGNLPAVSQQEVAMISAELAKAQAKLDLSKAELDFTVVKAPFDGIIDRLHEQQGSLVKEGEILTNLSDNSLMWVYFNVPEARYLEYKARQGKTADKSHLKLVDSRIELVLADGSTFNQTAGDVVTMEGKFNNETGNIQFRADFPNPDGLLRHGQTGSVLIHTKLKHAVVIPQRAVYEVLDKQYVYVVGDDHVARQREIEIQHEMEDVYVIKKGLDAKDRIILEGGRRGLDGKTVEFEYRKPEEALADQKQHAE